jgi:hypothetical protein
MFLQGQSAIPPIDDPIAKATPSPQAAWSSKSTFYHKPLLKASELLLLLLLLLLLRHDDKPILGVPQSVWRWSG